MIETRGPAWRKDAGPGLRVLLYSHDTFGLGHLRRTRTIANALAAAGMRAQIISGSAVVGRYSFAEGVDAVRIPSVAKQPDGAYASRDTTVPLARTVEMRSEIIADAARAFRPHLIVVDKEPTGFHGELLPLLEQERSRGSRLVLGLRDVLDDPERLEPEWRRKGAFEAIALYDEIWIYGVPRLHEPLAALALPPETTARIAYTGYLRRGAAESGSPTDEPPALTRGPFILVTPGGGGDGAGLVDWVIAAYETDRSITLPALIAFGPFMCAESRAGFLSRIARMPERVAAIDFDSAIERLMERATGIVAMGGYNTFCEILSFDKRAILVPRTEPRREQSIRAAAAQSLGLARVLMEADGREPERMAAALHALTEQPPPSRIIVPGLLDGLDVIGRRVAALMQPASRETEFVEPVSSAAPDRRAASL